MNERMNEGQVPERQGGGQGCCDRQLVSTTQFVDNSSRDRVRFLLKRREMPVSKFSLLLFLWGWDAGVNSMPRLQESS